jgi:hypothetical protein
VRIGHASVRDQLDWCREEGVSQAVITHCGSQIVRADASVAAARVQTLGQERGIEVVIAHDGMKLTVRKGGVRLTAATESPGCLPLQPANSVFDFFR